MFRQNRTQHIYHGTDARKATNYVQIGDTRFIKNPGHAGCNGRAIQQTVPVSFLREPRAKVYDAEPNDEWRQVCEILSKFIERKH